MAQSLEGKTIVIIGGTSGLGLAAVQACIESGAKVVAVGRNEEKVRQAEAKIGSSVLGVVGDATNPTTAETSIQTCVEAFGSFDGLYHVAGGSGRSFGDGPLDELTDEGFTQTLDLNLRSIFLSNRAAVRQLLKQKTAGSIVNMGSVLAFSPSPKHFATHAYATAKAGIIGLTTAAAAHYASHNIRFNVIAPALVETPMAQRAANDQSIQNFIKTKQPLDGGRIGHPNDAAAAAVFFLSDQSKFITGQVLAVDGGWTVSEGQHSP